jgi:pyrroloquinoline quinone (PQQ) biosynthesis protein C
MTSKSTVDMLESRLTDSPARARFVDHAFFDGVEAVALDARQAAICVGQWWHPLHYFPTFLARCVAVIDDIESKCAVAVILSQESGAGHVERAHEVVYADTMLRAGFTREQVVASEPFPETAALVAGYERLSASGPTALGSIYATEVTDLLMVSSIGTVVRKATGAIALEWVDIHVEQEPDHVEEANHTMARCFTDDEEDAVFDSAEEMWELWSAFFDRLEGEVLSPASARWPVPSTSATR